MSVHTITGTAVAFDHFWNWLKLHPNCIGEASSHDITLYDHDLMHWHLFEDETRRPVVQLIMGKALAAEMVMDVRDVLFVQGTAQSQEGEEVGFLFEVMAGTPDESVPVYRFLVAHGMDESAGPHLADAH